jgi:hypothetical protein
MSIQRGTSWRPPFGKQKSRATAETGRIAERETPRDKRTEPGLCLNDTFMVEDEPGTERGQRKSSQ